MRRTIAIGLALLLLAALTAGTVGAAPRIGGATERPTTVAVAIGQVVEDDGMRNTFDLRAQTDGARVGGTLRFYCPHKGYYNGAVRTLAVENGTIKATGGGGLFQPDGTRIPVRYTATITPDQRVDVVVSGPNGFGYTIAGKMEPGLVRAGDPRTLTAGSPAAAPAAPDHKH